MNDPAPNESKESVPLFGSWRNAYLAVVVLFVLDVALFYIFQRYFS
ncbi:MAG: hypothetical protein ACXWBM_07355 [Chthoniobacterales bacterium]